MSNEGENVKKFSKVDLPKFNSEFTPEKLPKPNRRGSSSVSTIFQRQKLLNFGRVYACKRW